jgi:hypothetical protein
MLLLLAGEIWEARHWDCLSDIAFMGNFVKIGSDTQVIPSLLHKQFERPQCWYC